MPYSISLIIHKTNSNPPNELTTERQEARPSHQPHSQSEQPTNDKAHNPQLIVLLRISRSPTAPAPQLPLPPKPPSHRELLPRFATSRFVESYNPPPKPSLDNGESEFPLQPLRAPSNASSPRPRDHANAQRVPIPKQNVREPVLRVRLEPMAAPGQASVSVGAVPWHWTTAALALPDQQGRLCEYRGGAAGAVQSCDDEMVGPADGWG